MTLSDALWDNILILLEAKLRLYKKLDKNDVIITSYTFSTSDI